MPRAVETGKDHASWSLAETARMPDHPPTAAEARPAWIFQQQAELLRVGRVRSLAEALWEDRRGPNGARV
jgi:hypothetical protein